MLSSILSSLLSSIPPMVISMPLKSTKKVRASLGILPQVNLGPFIQKISERRESPPLSRPTTLEKENESVEVTSLPEPMLQIQGSKCRRRTSRDGFWSQLDWCRNTRPRQGETQTEGEVPTIFDEFQKYCSQTEELSRDTQTTARSRPPILQWHWHLVVFPAWCLPKLAQTVFCLQIVDYRHLEIWSQAVLEFLLFFGTKIEHMTMVPWWNKQPGLHWRHEGYF